MYRVDASLTPDMLPAEYDAENLLRSDAGLTVAGT